jgi:hypothetical protein
MITVEILLERFRHELLVNEHSIPVARRKAGFRAVKCEASMKATKHPSYYKAKLDHFMQAYPHKKGLIRQTQEAYNASLRD